ncbi:MAG: FkbM family methyltransferase [Bdellovibrionales bacterium]
MQQTSYASSAEDLLVARYFPADFVGTYVDVGCYKPVDYSNTYLFYQRGWRGLCIDAADYKADYAAQRPGDTFVQSGVGVTPGTLTYYVIPEDPTSNTFDARLVDAMRQHKGFTCIEQQVPVQPLSDILAAHPVERIDFLNIDIEGMDIGVLKAFDFNRYRPRVIAIEDLMLDLHNPMFSETVAFLESKSYLFHSKAFFTAIFVDPRTPAEVELFKTADANRGRLLKR